MVKSLAKKPKISDQHVLGFRSFDILLSSGAILDFLLIYALLSRNFYVEIYALAPQIFCDSANFYTFRMYDLQSPQFQAFLYPILKMLNIAQTKMVSICMSLVRK